jgi:hypothetical protein
VPIQHNYDYQSTYQQALQVNWQAEYIIGEGTLWIARGQCIEQYGAWSASNSMEPLRSANRMVTDLCSPTTNDVWKDRKGRDSPHSLPAVWTKISPVSTGPANVMVQIVT